MLMALCSLCAAFSFFFYIPCMIYFPNAEEFVFTFGDFWQIPLLCFLAAALIFYIIGRLLPDPFQMAWCGVLVAFGLMVFLQSSFLLEDLGTFNGLPYLWRDHFGRIVSDALLWMLAALVMVYFAVRAKEKGRAVLTGMSGILLAFLMITAAVTILSSKKEYLRSAPFFVSDRELMNVSQEGDVILLVLDMFDASYMEEILRTSPEMAEELDGFTHFTNAVSCFGSTGYSLGSLLSGMMMLNQQPSFSETLNAGYETEHFFETLFEYGWGADLYTEAKFIPEALAAGSGNCLFESASITDIPAFCSALFRMAACTALPDVVRPFVWLSGTEFDGLYGVKDSPSKAYTIDNLSFFHRLTEEGLASKGGKCFRMIHLFGAHYPYTIDASLMPIPPSYSDENANAAAKGAMRISLRYLEELKRLDAYDSSLILLMADHGYSVDGGLTNPLLMIKPPYATGELKSSRAPVSFADLPETILAALNLPSDAVSGEDAFSLQEGQPHERLYYQMFDTASNGQGRLVEYSVAPDGNERRYYRLTDREISPTGEISKHSETCETCRLFGLEPVEAPNDASILH